MAPSPKPNSNADDVVESLEAPVKKGPGILPLALVTISAVILLPWAVWAVLLRDPGLSPEEQFQKSLELLSEGKNRDALRYIRPLDEMGYSDMDFGGGVEYVIGIIAFRDAELPELTESARQRMYRMAIAYLREAERKTIDSSYYLEFSHALGTSLFHTGKTRESFPFLQTVFGQSKQHKVEASYMLAEAYLNPNVQPSEMDRLGFQERYEQKIKAAREHNQIVIQSIPQTQEELEQATSRQLMFAAKARNQVTRIELAENNLERAQEALDELNTIVRRLNRFDTQKAANMLNEVELIKAQIAIANQDYQAAKLALDQLTTKNSSLNKELSNRAHYLLGICFEKLGNVDEALKNYEDASLDEGTDEAIAATLAAADLLRSVKLQHERALDLYNRALKLIGDTESFNNRWLSLDQIRGRVRAAWEMWTQSGSVTAKNYKWAIQLSDVMPPLFPEDYANEMAAQANVRWAEHLQETYDQASVLQKKLLSEELLEQWNRAGKAYAKLAYSRRAQENYAESLRLAFEMYYKGKDFENALLMINQFLSLQPKNLLATALVQKGRLLMDAAPFGKTEALFNEAGELFRSVILNSPKDPAAFTAHALLGQVALELNQTDEAITIWRKVISNDALSPEATEWQYSLFSLGKTLFNTAEPKFIEARVARATGDEQTAQILEEDSYGRLTEAVQRLGEYLQRNPNGANSADAAWMQAKALQRLAERPRQKLKEAETVNARAELKQDIRLLLDLAIARYATLREMLQPKDSLDELSEIHQQILHDAYFEPAHSLYILARFDDQEEGYIAAIEAYSEAVNQFPQDAQILLAYYQIANAYQKINRPAEAKRQLERARVILEQLPDESFTSQSSNYSRKEWHLLLDNAIQFRSGNLQTATGN